MSKVSATETTARLPVGMLQWAEIRQPRVQTSPESADQTTVSKGRRKRTRTSACGMVRCLSCMNYTAQSAPPGLARPSLTDVATVIDA